MIQGISNLSFPDRLKAFGLHSLKRRKCRGDRIEVFKWKKGINKGDISEVLRKEEKGITRSNGFNFQVGQVQIQERYWKVLVWKQSC